MDIDILNNGQPQNKQWLNPSVYDIKCHSMETQTTITTVEIDTDNLTSDIILLNQNAVVGVPPVDYSLLYADNLDRLKVASQLAPTETIAYLSDIPITPPAVNNKIESTDLSASVECKDAGEVDIIVNGNNKLICNDIKSKLECGNSSLQLAAVSDGTSQDTTTYIGASDNANIKNTVSIYLPNDYQILQNNGAIQRMIVDDDKSSLYSKSVLTGSSGSFLNLNDDSSFSIGSYFSNNGAVECSTNSMAIVGAEAKSAIVLTNSNITTSLFNGSARIDREIMDASSQVFKDGNQVERLRVDNNGVSINNTYTLTNSGGIGGQVLTTDGLGTTSWQTPATPQVYGLYSQIATKTVANTTVETSLISPIGVGSLTVPPLYFQDGYSFLYKTGGLFRDSSNGQTIRFRLRNSGVLFDSGILTLSNVNTSRGWNIEAQFTYYGGNIITNFQFSYTNGNNDSFGFNNQGTNAINNAVSNTLDFTVQWGTASALNTISSNYGTLTKIF